MNFMCYEHNCEGVYTLEQLVHYYCENILGLRASGFSSFEDWMRDLLRMQILIEVK